MRSKQRKHRYSCAGFNVADAEHWYRRKGAGHAARLRNMRNARFVKSGGRIYLERGETWNREVLATIVCRDGRLTAYSGSYNPRR
jgi:hypothetical protein